MFSLQQNWTTGQNRFCLEMRGMGRRGGGWGEGGEMYTHMNKGVNNKKIKIKLKKEKSVLSYTAN
jgi:hypothetical protein